MEKFIKKVRDGNQVILPNAPAGKGHHDLEDGELTWSGENIMIYHGKTKGLVEINKKGDKNYKIGGGSIKDTNVDVSSKTLTLSTIQKQDIAGNFIYSDLVSVGATADSDFSIGNYEIHAGRIKLSQESDAEGVIGYNSVSGIFEMQDGTSKMNVMVHNPTTGLVKQTRSSGNNEGISDKEILGLLQNLIKQRKDSIESFKTADRKDLIEKEEIEIKIINVFLPDQKDQEQTIKLIEEIIQSNNLSSIKDMGKLMGIVKNNFSGQVDMGLVGKIAKSKLEN